VVLLLSDGKNTQGATEPSEAAAQAKALGVPVYTVALGTQGGTIEVPDPVSGQLRSLAVPPDLDTLRSVAEETGGEFFEAPDEASLERVYEDLGSRVGTEQEEQEITAGFAAAGAVLLLGAGALSALWFNRLV
jgi:Ca-activated chloride channel family protein